jgi:CheY-like chemotaxis protein
MLSGDLANTDAGFKGKSHHLPAKRVIVRTPSLSHNLNPLHRSSHCGCHSGCLTSIIRHDPKLNATPSIVQGAEIGRLQDEWLIRAEMVGSLEDSGYEALEELDGMEVLRLLRDPDSVDIGVTDISMPVMDGIAVKRNTCLKHTQCSVVFASASADGPTLPQPIFALQKPYTGDQLVRMVEAVLA